MRFKIHIGDRTSFQTNLPLDSPATCSDCCCIGSSICSQLRPREAGEKIQCHLDEAHHDHAVSTVGVSACLTGVPIVVTRMMHMAMMVMDGGQGRICRE